jgi:hypothetical protein
MIPPTSQKGRAIRFTLLLSGVPMATHELVVRPEELTRIEPNRVTVHNTLGGAYVDAFGAGIQQIQLSGTLGWRGSRNADGEAHFLALRETVRRWNSLRDTRVAAALSPDVVELVFVDALDSIAVVVAPLEFTLLRSRHSPLLMRYRIRLAVVNDLSTAFSAVVDFILGAIANVAAKAIASLGSLTGIASLQGSMSATFAGLGGSLGALAPAGSAFLSASGNLLTAVAAGVSVNGLISASLAPTYVAAVGVQAAGAAVFTSLAGLAGLPAATVYAVSAAASSFAAAYCALVNGFDQTRSVVDIEPLFGASNCSSTTGGRAPSAFSAAGTNPFESMPLAAGAVSGVQTTASAQAMANAAALDPLATQLSMTDAANYLGAITEGLRL